MELRQLRNFLTVSRTLNISEAARRLHISQPALSRQISDLERTLEQPLFLRQAGALRLTDAGKVLRVHGSKAIALVDDAVRRTRNLAAPTTTEIRVGYYGVTWAVLVEPALNRLRHECPDLKLNLSEETPARLSAELRQGRLDVVVLNRKPTPQKTLISRHVAKVPMLIALPAGHHLARKSVVSINDLRKEKIVSFTQRAGFGRDRPFISACRQAGFTPSMFYAAHTLSGLLLSIATHHGIGLVTAFARGAPHPGVVFRKLKAPVHLDIYSAHSQSAPPAARRLVELIALEGNRFVTKT